MFNIFKKKQQGQKIVFRINGMHCTSCSINIDGELEDTTGVIQADTSYAQSKTTVIYDAIKITPLEIQKVIEGLNYKASQIK